MKVVFFFLGASGVLEAWNEAIQQFGSTEGWDIRFYPWEWREDLKRIVKEDRENWLVVVPSGQSLELKGDNVAVLSDDCLQTQEQLRHIFELGWPALHELTSAGCRG